MIGRYKLVEPLAGGGMGSVYAAIDTSLGRPAAVKLLKSADLHDSVARERFLREARTMAAVQHAHVAQIFDAGVDQGVPYLVMELLSGQDLKRQITTRGSLTIEETLAVLFPVCSALATAHAQGVVHRDLKPANVFLQTTRAGTVPKVIDFGVAKLRTGTAPGPALTATAAIVGTPAYMAPEQVDLSRDVDARADQWALGVLAYECLSAVQPFDRGSGIATLVAVVNAEHTSLDARVPHLPPGLCAVVERALRPKPADRFPDVMAFGAALLPFASAGLRAKWASEFGGAAPDAGPAQVSSPRRSSAPPTPAPVASAKAPPDTVTTFERSLRAAPSSSRWIGAVVLALVALAALLGGLHTAGRAPSAASSSTGVAAQALVTSPNASPPAAAAVPSVAPTAIPAAVPDAAVTAESAGTNVNAAAIVRPPPRAAHRGRSTDAGSTRHSGTGFAIE